MDHLSYIEASTWLNVKPPRGASRGKRGAAFTAERPYSFQHSQCKSGATGTPGSSANLMEQRSFEQALSVINKTIHHQRDHRRKQQILLLLLCCLNGSLKESRCWTRRRRRRQRNVLEGVRNVTTVAAQNTRRKSLLPMLCFRSPGASVALQQNSIVNGVNMISFLFRTHRRACMFSYPSPVSPPNHRSSYHIKSLGKRIIWFHASTIIEQKK